MESLNQSKQMLSRREFLKVTGLLGLATVTGAATSIALERRENPDKELLFLSSLSDIEHANIAHWDYYQERTEQVFRQVMEGQLPEWLSAVGFDISRADGSSEHLVRRGDDVHFERKKFDTVAGSWVWGDSTQEEFTKALNESLFINVAYRTSGYETDSDEAALKNLSEETKCKTSGEVQNVHEIRMRRDYGRDLGQKLVDRRIVDAYFFIENPEIVKITTQLVNTPDGFRANESTPTPPAFFVGDNPMHVPSDVLAQSVVLLREASELITES